MLYLKLLQCLQESGTALTQPSSLVWDISYPIATLYNARRWVMISSSLTSGFKIIQKFVINRVNGYLTRLLLLSPYQTIFPLWSYHPHGTYIQNWNEPPLLAPLIHASKTFTESFSKINNRFGSVNQICIGFKSPASLQPSAPRPFVISRICSTVYSAFPKGPFHSSSILIFDLTGTAEYWLQ